MERLQKEKDVQIEQLKQQISQVFLDFFKKFHFFTKDKN
jgi:hypothetical protein